MPTQTIEVLRIPGTLFPRGPFDENADYKFLNFVESGGNGYVCLQPCTGIPVTNTAYWFKFVFKGEKGDAFTYADLTAEQKAELVRDATAAAQAAASSAQSAADDAAAVLQKFNTIKAAIDAIDPQSTEGSIQTLAAKQGLLEADLNALGPELYKEESLELTTSSVKLTIDTTNNVVATTSSEQRCYYAQVKAGDKLVITATNDTQKTFRFGFTEAVPAVGVSVTGTRYPYVTNLNENVVAPFNGYIVLSHSTSYFADHAVAKISSRISSAEANIASATALLDSIAYVELKHSVENYKKINGDGEVESTTSSSSANNLILTAEVSGYIGKTLYLDGSLFPTSGGGSTYCWYTFLDSNGSVVLKSEVSGASSKAYHNEPIIVPNGAKMLYVFGYALGTHPKANIKVNDAVSLDSAGTIIKSIRRFPLDICLIRASNGLPIPNANYSNKANKHTPDYIQVHSSIKLCNLEGMQQGVDIFYYDSNLALISNTTYVDSTEGLTEVVAENIPTNARWFRVSFGLSDANVGSRIEYTKFYVDIESEWGDGEETSKEPYREYFPFLYAVKVNIPMKIAGNPSIITKTTFAYDEGLIHLPSTYSPDGTPTPVIFFLHGDAERYELGESSFSGHMKMQQCWSDAGFAQVDLDLIPSCYNEPTMTSTGGTRDDLECLTAAWEWLTKHFNVDKRGFYLFGRSRGGQAVLEILGKGGALKLPIIAAVSMAGANAIFEYGIFTKASEKEWQLWCNAHGLPSVGRPQWSDSPLYSTDKSFLVDENCYNFVVNNYDVWWRKALVGWGMITKNSDGITPRDYFDNIVVPYANSNSGSASVQEFFNNMIATMEAKSPVPLRFDWCVGDSTQSRMPFTSVKGYSSTFTEIILNTPGSLAEYRQWDGVDESNPYGETNPHYAENMIFYDGNLTLPNGVVTSNPSKVTMEWLIWCMGKDPRYQGMDYTLPW